MNKERRRLNRQVAIDRAGRARDKLKPERAKATFDAASGAGCIAQDPEGFQEVITSPVYEMWRSIEAAKDAIEKLLEFAVGGGRDKERGHINAPDDRAVSAVCASCGSYEVSADAFARWDDENQMWEVHAIYDEAQCDECGHNRIKWVDRDI